MKTVCLALALLAATVFYANAYAYDGQEELRLNDLRDEALKQCHGDVPCRQAVRKHYEKLGLLLRTDPQKYWSNGGGTIDGKQARQDAKMQGMINAAVNAHSHQ